MDEAPSVILPGVPISPYFAVKQTPHAGRAVFATQDIPAGTLIHTASDLRLSVLLREYRREVCAYCFAYDRGVEWKLRDPSTYNSFCSPTCQTAWLASLGLSDSTDNDSNASAASPPAASTPCSSIPPSPTTIASPDKELSDPTTLSLAAYAAIESLTRKRSKEDIDLVDADVPRPSPAQIQTAWSSAGAAADAIRRARAGSSTAKPHRKALARAIAAPIAPDTLLFLTHGVLTAHFRPTTGLREVETLAADPTPYASAAELAGSVRSYLHLLAVLPTPLLEAVTPGVLITLANRDSHNSFGIRSLGDGGSEFFGYGVWPSASFFNHSCDPNVMKERRGREWRFWVERDVRAGEQLCITYLSGEERALGTESRLERLRRGWGFECGCERCVGV